MRGTARHGLSRATAPIRFIPARAGNGLSAPSQGSPRHGSSPRVRGTAGNGRGRLTAFATVHPRACGERTARYLFPHFTGSSPRVRGTVSRRLTSRATSVHPRACGERIARVPSRFISACGERRIQLGIVKSDGSSPRVRGTVLEAYSGCPRVRTLPVASGSSPRVRGTALRLLPKADRVRFIPARAGNGSHGSECIPDIGDRFIPARAGNGGGHARQRFIPARAGNGSIHRRPADQTVHPRACGERAFGEAFPRFTPMRGTLLAHRFIPARAGNGSDSGSAGTFRGRNVDRRFIPARAGNGLDVMLFIICDLHAG